MPRSGADLDARHDPPAAQVHHHELAARPVADEGVASVGGHRRVARRSKSAYHASDARGAHAQQRERSGRRVGHDDVPARSALDAAGVLDGGQPALHLAAAEPDDHDVGLGVRGRQRERLAGGGRAHTGERRQRGEAQAEERAAIDVHACHYGAAVRAGPPAAPPYSSLC